MTEQPGQDSGDRTAGTEKYVFVYVYVYSMSINIGAAIALIVPGSTIFVIMSANYHSMKYDNNGKVRIMGSARYFYGLNTYSATQKLSVYACLWYNI